MPGTPPSRRRRWFVAVLALVGASCQAQGGRQAGPPVVTVGMAEYRFDYDPAIPAGRVVFEARNRGKLPHSLDLVPLPEDLARIDVQLRSQQKRALPSFAGLPSRTAGRRGVFAVDLVPGRYAMVCFVKDGDGELHAHKGMASEFRVR